MKISHRQMQTNYLLKNQTKHLVRIAHRKIEMCLCQLQRAANALVHYSTGPPVHRVITASGDYCIWPQLHRVITA